MTRCLEGAATVVRDGPSPAWTAWDGPPWDYGVRSRWCRLRVSATVGRPLDPQDYGLGVSADQSGHGGGVVRVPRCRLSRVGAWPWSPYGPQRGQRLRRDGRPRVIRSPVLGVT